MPSKSPGERYKVHKSALEKLFKLLGGFDPHLAAEITSVEQFMR